MAEFDQNSKDYIAEAIAEMEANNSAKTGWSEDSTDHAPDCTVCSDEGKPNGCEGCGATR